LTKEQFKFCFDKYINSLRSYVYYRSGNQSIANDIVQDVFLKLWEKDFQFDENKIKNLLYKMTNNAFIDYCRKNKKSTENINSLAVGFTKNEPEVQLEFQEFKTKYEKTLASLPEKQRVVFLMSRVEDLKYKEIAERLNISQKAIEKRMSLALKMLKQKL
jgi:RNA polymerase sigma-70 factor (ECF subfamily)